MQKGDAFEALLQKLLGSEASLRVIAGAGAEEEREVLFGKTDTRGARGDLQDAGLVVDVLAGLGHGGSVGADNGLHVRGGEFLGGQGSGAGIAGVILDDNLDLLAIDTALLVGLLYLKINDVLHVEAFGSPLAGHGAHETDFIGVSGPGLQRKRKDKGQTAHPEYRMFHGSPRFLSLAGRFVRPGRTIFSPERT